MNAFSLVDRTLYGEWPGKPGDKLTQLINFIQIILSLILFFRGSRRWPSLRKGGLISISLALFLLCSAAWSISSGETIRLAVQYLFLIVAAIGVAENLEPDDFMHLLALVCLVAGIASLALLVVAPASAFGESSHDFRGIFSQKNLLGEAMSMGALAALHGLRARRGSRYFSLATLAVASFLAFKSQSATSCSAIVFFCVLDVAIRLLRKGGSSRTLVLTGTIILVPLIVVAAFNWGSILELFGKDATLTGRTDLWGFVVLDIKQRPLLGWGYGAFWSTTNPAVLEIAGVLHWFPPQAHNGLLEILLNVGFVGAVFFICLWGRTVRLSLKGMRISKNTIATTCFLSCAGVILVGISETVLLYNGPITYVFLIASLFCERSLSVARQQRAFRPEHSVRVRTGESVSGLSRPKSANVA